MQTRGYYERVASETRYLFENKLVKLDLLARLYKQYTDIDDSQVFVSRALDLFPNLNCGLCSVYLQHQLPELIIVRGWYGENRHTFCVTLDHLVIDITADQYDGPKIHLGELIAPWKMNNKHCKISATIGS